MLRLAAQQIVHVRLISKRLLSVLTAAGIYGTQRTLTVLHMLDTQDTFVAWLGRSVYREMLNPLEAVQFVSMQARQ